MIVQKTQNMPRPRRSDKSRLLQRNLYCAAKSDPNRRFGVLFDKVIREDVLATAWKMVRASRGAAGIDRISFEDIEQYGVGRFLSEIRQDLIQGKYNPSPVRRRLIPKTNGKMRPLGIPTIRDRVVQMAVKLVIEPLFEADFQDFSYGFRPKRSAHQAIMEVRKYINYGCWQVVDIDLKNFFDTIPHDKLMMLVARRVSDRRVLKLILQWLKGGIVSEQGLERSIIGTPQGGVISPLLANIFLNEVDREWKCRGYDHRSRDAHLFRYADDIVIVCQSDPEFYLREVKCMLESLGVALNEEKSRVVEASDGFDFLGIHFRVARSKQGRMNCYYWPSHSALSKFRKTMHHMIHQRKTINIRHIIDAVNPTIRGWGQYFMVTNAGETMWNLDRFICKRINKLVKKSRKIRGVENNIIPAKILYESYGLFSLYSLVKGRTYAAQ